MAESRMPARIWAPSESAPYSTTYIRADLVEPLVEALREVRSIISDGAATGFNCHDGDWAERLFKSQATTFAALSSWEAPQSGQAQTEARG